MLAIFSSCSRTYHDCVRNAPTSFESAYEQASAKVKNIAKAVFVDAPDWIVNKTVQIIEQSREQIRLSNTRWSDFKNKSNTVVTIAKIVGISLFIISALHFSMATLALGLGDAPIDHVMRRFIHAGIGFIVSQILIQMGLNIQNRANSLSNELNIRAGGKFAIPLHELVQKTALSYLFY
jgi:hypothetical protein